MYPVREDKPEWFLIGNLTSRGKQEKDGQSKRADSGGKGRKGEQQ